MSDNNVYELSDDDFATMDLSTFDDKQEDESELEDDSQEMPDDSDEDESTEAEDDDSETEEDEDDEEDEETDEDDEEGDDTESDADTSEDNDEDDVTHDEEEDEDTSEDVDIEESPVAPKAKKKSKSNTSLNADMEAFYETLTAPFKANGKEFTITNAEDIKALMQQGINYSKNMAELKPDRALLKTLKEHNLTKPDDLSYLIDLHNKDPKAIARLIKESNINLYEFDTDIADGYAPSQKVIQPSKLDDVVEELDKNPSFGIILNDITSGWDVESKRFITDNPGVLKVLTEQKENGLYDRIIAAVEHEHMLGRMTDVPFIEAYTNMEQHLSRIDNPTSKGDATKERKFKAPRPSGNKNTDNSKKRKASSPQVSNKSAKANFNALAVSDEDLMKSFN